MALAVPSCAPELRTLGRPAGPSEASALSSAKGSSQIESGTSPPYAQCYHRRRARPCVWGGPALSATEPHTTGQRQTQLRLARIGTTKCFPKRKHFKAPPGPPPHHHTRTLEASPLVRGAWTRAGHILSHRSLASSR